MSRLQLSVCAVAAIGLAVGSISTTLAEPTAATPTSPQPSRRATLYAFFATWCVPCRVEIPHIERLHRTYARRGLEVILVSEDAPSSAQQIPSFLARFGVTAKWILDNESVLLEKYNSSANIPFTVIVDANGRALFAHAGYQPGDEDLLERAALKAIGTPSSAAIPRTALVRAANAVRAARPTGPSRRLNFTSSFQGLGVRRTSRFDPMDDGELRAMVGRLEVAARSGGNTANARIDGSIVDDETAPNDRDARLERVRLGTRFGNARLYAGDGYAQFGQGLSLSLRKVDPLGLDTSIRGARVDVSTGKTRVTVLAGWTNPQNIDPLELRVVDDINDFVAGAEARIALGKWGTIAPYTLVAHANGAASDGGDVLWLSNGVSTQLGLGSFRITAELAGGVRDGMQLDLEFARAAFASLQWSAGRLTALADAKMYRHWEIGRGNRGLLYHEPPTLEREDQQVPGNENTVGARARVEYRLPIRATIFANAVAYKYSLDQTDPLDGKTALHGYVGLEKRFARTASVSFAAGYRDENHADGSDKLSLWHVDIDGALSLSRRFAVSAKWNHREETEQLFSQVRFRRGLGVLGFSLSGWGTASLLAGYSTEPIGPQAPTYYPAGELLVHLPNGGNARLFVGRLTGGRICVSGSCRDVPPFQGARLDLVWRM